MHRDEKRNRSEARAPGDAGVMNGIGTLLLKTLLALGVGLATAALL